MVKKKSLAEKLDNESKIVEDPKGRGEMLIPNGFDVIEVIRKIPKGKLATTEDLRNYMAHEAGADLTCPMVFGIMLRLAAEYAEQERSKGSLEKEIPYWRVVDKTGALNPKFPGGVELQMAYLEAEGFEFKRLKSKVRVLEFEKRLVKL